MVDFSKHLSTNRAAVNPTMKERLQRIRDSQRKGAPSMRPKPRQQPEKEEEPLYDVRELGLDAVDADAFMRLSAQYTEHQQAESAAKKQKELIGAQLKKLCHDYGLRKVTAGDLPVTYYQMSRSTVDGLLLKANGVKAAIVEACTVTTTSWAIRVGQARED